MIRKIKNGKEPPFAPLLQEYFLDDPWKILVVCMLLNQTTRKQVDKVVGHLFGMFPTPESMAKSAPEHFARITEIIRPLGLASQRSIRLSLMSSDFLKGVHPKEMYGVGKYAVQAWEIFVEGKSLDPRDVKDKALHQYATWLQMA